ncbi:hem-binding uptake Tiki superfamily ChaN [Arabidopsis suecica]|uniref:Hem-binding uptake Tiki superfamily ChaN n=1 Tax=Arabidopsis suecica TaxID=45249 RepID=A0A8T1ZGA2_ARASU|nr:hem-binding uptake Tiki superfamily ChaN [Arabidopsis suecica]KAG7611766.1 hem-binding uptake Tiki superfamily ChaN [Arabidopsis suecica]
MSTSLRTTTAASRLLRSSSSSRSTLALSASSSPSASSYLSFAVSASLSRLFSTSLFFISQSVCERKPRKFQALLKKLQKLMNARAVYLGEAEQVPTKDDKELELEIVRNLRKRCVESQRQISVALEAFPFDFQDQLNQYMDKRINGDLIHLIQ